MHEKSIDCFLKCLIPLQVPLQQHVKLVGTEQQEPGKAFHAKDPIAPWTKAGLAVIDATSLEVSKARLDGVWSKLV
ncbi:hypothetical protein HGM15179_007490 [Zosterops borbonicus]|uniref:Uncharacterized protein n=1 Tax=Zosterops borbonicus TaxID=364589 RepID=A0A8K1LMU6_9PASS|nr:hypothetical protein HGM15179_007490 [Zosterops borbonicus]